MSDSLIRLPEVMERTSLTRSAVFKLQKLNMFPKSVQLSGTRAVAWSANAVDEWIKQQLENAESTPVAAEWITGSEGVAAVASVGRGESL